MHNLFDLYNKADGCVVSFHSLLTLVSRDFNDDIGGNFPFTEDNQCEATTCILFPPACNYPSLNLKKRVKSNF